MHLLARHAVGLHHRVTIHLFEKDALVVVQKAMVALRLEQVLVHHVVDARRWLRLAWVRRPLLLLLPSRRVLVLHSDGAIQNFLVILDYRLNLRVHLLLLQEGVIVAYVRVLVHFPQSNRINGNAFRYVAIVLHVCVIPWLRLNLSLCVCRVQYLLWLIVWRSLLGYVDLLGLFFLSDGADNDLLVFKKAVWPDASLQGLHRRPLGIKAQVAKQLTVAAFVRNVLFIVIWVLLDGPVVVLAGTEAEGVERLCKDCSQAFVIWLGFEAVREHLLGEVEQAECGGLLLRAAAEVTRRHCHLGLLDDLEFILFAFALDLVDESEPVHVEEEDEVVDEGYQVVAPARADEVEGVLAREEHRAFELIFLAIGNMLTIFVEVVGH